jgi:hypothetical protein
VFFGIELDKQTQAFSNVPADDKVVFLAYCLAFRLDNTHVEMWINPPLGEKEPGIVDVAAVANQLRFDCVRGCSNPVPLSIDGLRIGTTCADIAAATPKK